MPNTPVIHYNSPSTSGISRCGIPLARVKRWTTDKNDATCNNCVRLIAKDDKPAPQE